MNETYKGLLILKKNLFRLTNCQNKLFKDNSMDSAVSFFSSTDAKTPLLCLAGSPQLQHDKQQQSVINKENLLITTSGDFT